MAYIPLNRPVQPGDPVGSVYTGGPKDVIAVKSKRQSTRPPQSDGLGIMGTTPPAGAPEGNKIFTQIPKTNVDKPMTYEMDSARKLNLKKVYDSNPTLQRKFKTFEKYLQQFMQPLKK